MGQGLLPLSYAYQQPGMLKFCGALIELGNYLSPNSVVDVEKILPYHTTVRAAIKVIAQTFRATFSEGLKEVL